MAKDNDNKSEVQGEQSKDIGEVDQYEEQNHMFLEEVAKSLQIPIKKIMYYAGRDEIDIYYLIIKDYTSKLHHTEIQRLIVNPDLEIRIPNGILSLVLKFGIHTYSPLKSEESLISMSSLVVRKEDYLELKKKVKQEKKTLIDCPKKLDNFDDVRLKVSIDDDQNLKKANIDTHISVGKSDYKRLKLDDRIRPVFYLLVNGVKHGEELVNNLVTNQSLRKMYTDVNEAKLKIVKSFTEHIGKNRAGKIIEIEHGTGKRLLIPKKNISIIKSKKSP